jgi:hypothetical protein
MFCCQPPFLVDLVYHIFRIDIVDRQVTGTTANTNGSQMMVSRDAADGLRGPFGPQMPGGSCGSYGIERFPALRPRRKSLRYSSDYSEQAEDEGIQEVFKQRSQHKTLWHGNPRYGRSQHITLWHRKFRYGHTNGEGWFNEIVMRLTWQETVLVRMNSLITSPDYQMR